MFTKTINYEDFMGNTRTETCYFNLTKTELLDLYVTLPKALSKAFEKIQPQAGDEEAAKEVAMEAIQTLGDKGILDFYKELVLKSYGIISEDGRRFVKDPEISKEFSQTLVYDQLMYDFMTDGKSADEFVNGLMATSKSAGKSALTMLAKPAE